MKKKKQKKKISCNPRNFLVPIVKMKRAMRIEDKRDKLLTEMMKKRELDRKIYRLHNWTVTFNDYD